MRFLVTGSNGLLGSRLCSLLSSQGHQVTGTSRGERRQQGTYDYASCDLADAEGLLRLVKQVSPEVVLHPASMTDVDGCEKNPEQAFLANVQGAASVAKATASVGAHLVHVSTDYVFDGERGQYSEEDLPNPRGVYAITKRMGEQAALLFSPSCTIARTAVVYGWPAAGKPNFGSWLVSALSQKQSIKLFEDQFVSPTLADNAAEMIAELGIRKLSGIFHTSGAETVNRVSFGRALCEQFGFDAHLITPSRMSELKLASPRPLKSGLNTQKVQRTLKAQPLGLAEALRRFHADYQKGIAS